MDIYIMAKDSSTLVVPCLHPVGLSPLITYIAK
jgi:hypothetical protein